MTEIKHPMETAPIHIFERKDFDGVGYKFLACIYPTKSYPVWFKGDTAQDAMNGAQAIIDEAVSKHKAAYVSRQEAKIKAAATRKAKELLK